MVSKKRKVTGAVRRFYLGYDARKGRVFYTPIVCTDGELAGRLVMFSQASLFGLRVENHELNRKVLRRLLSAMEGVVMVKKNVGKKVKGVELGAWGRQCAITRNFERFGAEGGVVKKVKKCSGCFGFGLWAVGDAVPMGPMDAADGMPTKSCPVCGVSANGGVVRGKRSQSAKKKS